MMQLNILKLYSKTSDIKVVLAVFLVLSGLALSQVILPSTAQASSPNYNINIAANARNLTSGQGYFSKNISVSSNDRLMFQIQIQNTGNATLDNVIVFDTLPSYIIYVPGTARLNDERISDGVASGGINIGSIFVNSSRFITFEATAIYAGTSQNLSLTNYVYTHTDQANQDSDTSTIYLSRTATVGTLNINNSVRNLTAGQITFSSETYANAGNRVIFLIELTLPVNAVTLTDLRVWDVLPAGLTYIGGSARLDGNYISDSIVSSGINPGIIYASQGHRISFEASVSASANQILTNYAYVSGEGIYERSASAQITINQTAVTSSSNSANPNQIQTAPVAALTGSDSKALTFAFSAIGALVFVLAFYFLIEYTVFWQDWRFKLAILKARMRK